MNIVLWVIQGLLCFAFVMAGGMKLILGKPQLAAKMKWVDGWSASRVKLLGFAEVLGGVGLVAPRATDIHRYLTPIAAACLVPLMIGAVFTHVRDREGSSVPAVVLGGLAAFVAFGRVALVP